MGVLWLKISNEWMKRSIPLVAGLIIIVSSIQTIISILGLQVTFNYSTFETIVVDSKFGLLWLRFIQERLIPNDLILYENLEFFNLFLCILLEIAIFLDKRNIVIFYSIISLLIMWITYIPYFMVLFYFHFVNDIPNWQTIIINTFNFKLINSLPYVIILPYYFLDKQINIINNNRPNHNSLSFFLQKNSKAWMKRSIPLVAGLIIILISTWIINEFYLSYRWLISYGQTKLPGSTRVNVYFYLFRPFYLSQFGMLGNIFNPITTFNLSFTENMEFFNLFFSILLVLAIFSNKRKSILLYCILSLLIMWIPYIPFYLTYSKKYDLSYISNFKLLNALPYLVILTYYRLDKQVYSLITTIKANREKQIPLINLLRDKGQKHKPSKISEYNNHLNKLEEIIEENKAF